MMPTPPRNRFGFVLTLLCAAAMLFFTSIVPAQAFDKGPELDKEKDYYALIETTEGSATVKLYADKAPITVRNFVNLAEGTAESQDPKSGGVVKRPFYNDAPIFRVIPGQFIMTGRASETQEGPGYTIPDELDKDVTFSKPGILAMANKGPETGGSQFFITAKVMTSLNGKHAIFGEVLEHTDGLDVVTKISELPRDAREKPVKPVKISKVTIFKLEKGLDAKAAAEKIPGTTYVSPTPAGEADKKQKQETK
ncbi:MAG TPA: peptidylprolyl isomerase [Candidatus Sumerlaeota bacterium]|nr:peptidylprolyl isomerase [Candidatus Sumerlaeota bacterium]